MLGKLPIMAAKTFFIRYKMYFIIAAVLAAVAAIVMVTRTYYVNSYESKIAKRELEIKTENLKNQKLARDLEHKLQLATSQIGIENVKIKTETRVVYRNFKSSGVLHDPGKTKRKPTGLPNDSRTTSDTTGPIENSTLSPALTEFLFDTFEDADTTLADYKACYEWAKQVTAILNPTPPHTTSENQ